MASSTITGKGQMTVPKAIRERFHLESGDRVDCVVDDGRIIVVPAKRSLPDLARILPAAKRRISLEDMDRAIRTRGGSRP